MCSYECGIAYSKRCTKKQKDSLDEARQKIKTSSRKTDLQKEINKLARLIDFRFNFKCIDTGKPIKGSGNGAHYKNVGGNENIRFNLHNIHLSTVYANKYNPEHKKGYLRGLLERYGEEYQEYLESGLNRIYARMSFTSDEIQYALKVTRRIIREFETYDLTNPILARDMFNSMIGLYDKPFIRIKK